ncbi:Uncharacterised protein [Vibrio cholerae]|nr:Uncharacterised protein [Vibrio cholerae]
MVQTAGEADFSAHMADQFLGNHQPKSCTAITA